MINNPTFRRSANCGRFDTLLEGRELPLFPIEKIKSQALTQSWINSNGLEKPVLIENATGLGLKLPDPSSTLTDIAGVIGSDFPIKIIGVGEQAELPASLGDYAYYLANRTADHKILNLISLEVSATHLNVKVQSPSLVREVDWIDKCWPLDRRARGDFPQVQKYCLCGMAGSYTDFHVDFGGTSVWYHVLNGQKRFYLIPPTTANLRAYEIWTCSKSQDTVFFGDIVGKGNCFQLDLMAGQTLLIPGAWIHAVHTPIDSLVFGGNFLHSFSIIRQLQVYGIEQRTFVGKIYRFPHFKLVNWFVLCSLLPVAKKLLETTLSGPKDPVTPKDDDSESDDDSEDLVALCNSVKTPCVFRQFPYLVRNCHFWLLSADTEEHVAFLKAAQEAWCDDALDVVTSWWNILLNLADQLSMGIVDMKEKGRLRRHVERVRSLKVFDLLDDRIVAAGFGDDSYADAEVERNSPAKTERKLAKVNDAATRPSRVNSNNSSSSKATTEDDLKPLPRLKFKLNAQTEEKSEDKEGGDVEGTGGEEEEEVIKVDESALRFKFQMPAMSSLPSMTYGRNPPDSSDGSSTKFNISISSSSSGSSAQAQLLKSRMALQSERMRGIRTAAPTKGSGLVLSTKKIGVSVTKAAAKRKVRRVDEYEYEDRPVVPLVNHEFDESNILPEREGGGGRYGTRGKRVSAAFLLHAEDVDIREIAMENEVMHEGGGGGGGAMGMIDDDSELPFLFDDDAGAPYGEEEWVVGKDGKDEEEDDKGKDDDEEEDESELEGEGDSDEDEDDTYTARKRPRDAPVAPIAPAYLPLKSDKMKRASSKVQTSRMRLISKFK